MLACSRLTSAFSSAHGIADIRIAWPTGENGVSHPHWHIIDTQNNTSHTRDSYSALRSGGLRRIRQAHANKVWRWRASVRATICSSSGYRDKAKYMKGHASALCTPLVSSSHHRLALPLLKLTASCLLLLYSPSFRYEPLASYRYLQLNPAVFAIEVAQAAASTPRLHHHKQDNTT